MKATLLRLALGLGALATLAACGRSIGDQCSTNTDCSANGDRTCDLSQPAGYCTIEGCDATSCPSDSICVRFFPEIYLTQPCDPSCEDLATASCTHVDPATNAITKTDDCTADELCLAEGLCAPRAYEQRLCTKTCGSDGDCRGGYQCRPGNTRGSMPLLSDPNATASFCVPNPI